MARCNELCTKDATGSCALCEALAERDRFERFWFKGGLFIDSVRALERGMERLQDESKAPGLWLYPTPRIGGRHPDVVRGIGGRHPDVVREAHKQFSETINKIMLTLLSVSFFCLLAIFGSPDRVLLTEDSTIKIPLTDALMPFVGF